MPTHAMARDCAWGSLELDAALAEELGVLTHERARARPECARMLRNTAWVPLGKVVITHNGPMTEDQEDWSAILNCGLGAVWAAATCMRAFGVRVDRPPRPQIVVPAFRSKPHVKGVDVRRSRLLGPTEVHPVRQPPMMRLARATLDATSLSDRPDDVRALLCAPVQQRKLRTADLRTAIGRLPVLTGHSLVLRSLDDIELGAQTLHEIAFASSLRRAGLPQPDRQVMAQRPDGKAFLDGWWDDYDLHSEIDGMPHMWVGNWAADLLRNNDLEIDRTATRLRFAGFQVLEQEAVVMDQVRRGLIAGGWRP